MATSIGRLYLDPSFLLAPLGTLEPLQGRLDGDFALRVRGSGHDLQAFVDNLRFASEAGGFWLEHPDVRQSGEFRSSSLNKNKDDANQGCWMRDISFKVTS